MFIRVNQSLVTRAALILVVVSAMTLTLDRASFAGPGDIPPPDARRDDRFADDDFQMLQDPGFRVIPLQEAARIAIRRYKGRLIAARLLPPRPDERSRGVELVHELRLLTQRRDVLLIRLDARTGAFLEVAGSGLTEARRKDDDRE